MAAKARLAILGGVRTPFLRAGTGFRRASAAALARAAFVETLARCEIDAGALDEVILGCSGQPHDAQNLARVAALRAGVPERVPAVTVHRNCASGFETLAQALLRVRAGAGDLFLVGGVEAMSRAPLVFPESGAEWFGRLARAKNLGARVRTLVAVRPRFFKPRVSLVEALTDPVSGMIMGQTAETLAHEFRISREAQDEYALSSHRRAASAVREQRFAEEIAPVVALDDEGTVVAADNGIRADLTLEKLAKLPPYFDRRFGTVTVGNSCQVTDGAVAIVVASEARAAALSRRPLGWIDAWSFVGLDPARMGLGPAYATARLLAESGRKLHDFALVELNEAFAAQVLACTEAFASAGFAARELGRSEPLGELDRARLNPNGGAIALGHPPGATGVRLVLTLLHELARRGEKRGLATLCVGGGQGGAVSVEAA